MAEIEMKIVVDAAAAMSAIGGMANAVSDARDEGWSKALEEAQAAVRNAWHPGIMLMDVNDAIRALRKEST